MRGIFDDQGGYFRLFRRSSEVRHGFRCGPIHELVREMLRELDRDSRTRYSTTGRPSIQHK